MGGAQSRPNQPGATRSPSLAHHQPASPLANTPQTTPWSPTSPGAPIGGEGSGSSHAGPSTLHRLSTPNVKRTESGSKRGRGSSAGSLKSLGRKKQRQGDHDGQGESSRGGDTLAVPSSSTSSTPLATPSGSTTPVMSHTAGIASTASIRTSTPSMSSNRTRSTSTRRPLSFLSTRTTSTASMEGSSRSSRPPSGTWDRVLSRFRPSSMFGPSPAANALSPPTSQTTVRNRSGTSIPTASSSSSQVQSTRPSSFGRSTHAPDPSRGQLADSSPTVPVEHVRDAVRNWSDTRVQGDLDDDEDEDPNVTTAELEDRVRPRIRDFIQSTDSTDQDWISDANINRYFRECISPGTTRQPGTTDPDQEFYRNLLSLLRRRQRQTREEMQLASEEMARSQARMDQLQRERDETAARLAESERNLAEATARAISDGMARVGAGGSEGAGGEDTGPRRIPAGAVLIIQGLAQTSALPPPESTTRSGDSTTTSVPAMADESDDDGLTAGWAARRSRRSSRMGSRSSETPSQAREREREASLLAQARTISNLLTVAAAATATTLLSSDHQPTRPRPSYANTVTSFLDRFRPGRRNSNTNSVENSVSNYLRDALSHLGPLNEQQEDSPMDPSTTTGRLSNTADSQATASGSTGSSLGSTNGGISDSSTSQDSSADHNDSSNEPDPPMDASEEFRTFLDGLQGDLIDAVREFTEPPTETPGTESTHPTADPASADTPEVTSSSDSTETAAVGPSSSEPSTIPTFHAQPGQNIPNGGTSSAPRRSVTGGENGEPRRLNFFRAHLFPAVRPTEPTTRAAPGDQEAMVPCIFVGVRSISHDPSMTTDDLVRHPQFPFMDGHAAPVPDPTPGSTAPSNDSGSGAGDGEETGATQADPTGLGMGLGLGLQRARSEEPAPQRGGTTTFASTNDDASNGGSGGSGSRQSLGDRLRRFVSPRSSPPRDTSPSLPTGPLNTYLVYVIGGNYPLNHPILTIPHLMSGEPLSDEDMVLIGEMLGSVKPPTATKEDIEKSGLRIVKGGEVVKMGEAGEVLQNCVERCLICLGDYEEEEECRVLKCRHVYHKECVDHWLSQGRNSCPACRTEAVEKTSRTTQAATSTTTGATASAPTTSTDPADAATAASVSGSPPPPGHIPLTEEEMMSPD